MGHEDEGEKHFGNLACVRGVKYYRLSPFEQKTIGAAAFESLRNLIPRAWDTFPRWMVPFTVGAIVYYYGELFYKQSKRKNWRDYANEVDPNPPAKMICTVITEDVPYCERQDRKVEETRDVEVCNEVPPEIDEKQKKVLARKKLMDRLEKAK